MAYIDYWQLVGLQYYIARIAFYNQPQYLVTQIWYSKQKAELLRSSNVIIHIIIII